MIVGGLRGVGHAGRLCPGTRRGRWRRRGGLDEGAVAPRSEALEDDGSIPGRRARHPFFFRRRYHELTEHALQFPFAEFLVQLQELLLLADDLVGRDTCSLEEVLPGVFAVAVTCVCVTRGVCDEYLEETGIDPEVLEELSAERHILAKGPHVDGRARYRRPLLHGYGRCPLDRCSFGNGWG